MPRVRSAGRPRHQINYGTREVFTGGRGVDVIFDMVAGDYLARELDALAEGGRLVLIAPCADLPPHSTRAS